MKPKFCFPAILAFFILLFPLSSNAWGVLGHRIVGEIASGYLTPKAKAQIKKILGNESIALAGNWADFVRSNPGYNYLDRWHYINFEPGTTETGMREILKNDTSVNAYTKLRFLINELKKTTLSPKKKQQYLRLLIHILGDIHQPFHAGYAEDKGGNEIKVSWFNKRISMHSLWDSELIEFQQLSYTEYVNAINFTTAGQRKKIAAGDLITWFWDSFRIAETLYTDVKPKDKLGYRYNYDHIDTLNKQLLKGGVRLAALLNQIFV